LEEIEDEIKELKEQGMEDSDEAKRLANKRDKIEKHYSKLLKFRALYSKDNWIFNHIPAFDSKGRKLEFKPIDISQYSHEYLFKYGQKVVLLSATILNKDAFCESVGIDLDDAGFISIDSPFPKENTPVFYFPVGSMSKDRIDETLPTMVSVIKSLLEEHKHDKGIIHTRTFKIAQYLKQNIKSKRLLFHESSDKDEMLQEHIHSDKPTVILSPSSTEGLDLKGDLSRFQIICKMHWPYLGDQLVKARMDKHQHWYAYQAVKAMIQARGRSIRTAEDFAVTYILDNDFERLYAKNLKLFPKYFRQSLHMD
jgi:Rad3-related DNA helicase